MIVMPHGLAPMKPDFIALQFKSGFQMWLYKYFPDYFLCVSRDVMYITPPICVNMVRNTNKTIMPVYLTIRL